MEAFPDLFAGGPIAVNVLEKRYLKRNEKGELIEKPRDMFIRVARYIAKADIKYAEDPEVTAQIFYRMMATGDFEPNTPCLANAGWPGSSGSFSACYVLPVPDEIEGIMTTLKNMALIHRSGGGTGFNFSPVRPDGDYVKSTTGLASGPVSFMAAYNNTTEVIKQSGIRRGANMGILRVDHPDIMQFIHCKRKACEVCAEAGLSSCDHNIRNFNISVALTDAFMAAVDADTEYGLVNPRTKLTVAKLRAREVFEQIIENAWHSGEPGAFFVDRVNQRDSLSAYLGPIGATNPCVSGDTLVLTRQGHQRIDDLIGRKVEVWNGQEWSMVEPRVTGRNEPMVRVELSNGLALACTLYHTFYLADGTKVEAQHLEIGDTLEKLGISEPTNGPFTGLSEASAYLAGFYQGDGFYNTEKHQQMINFYGDDKIRIGIGLRDAGLCTLQPYSETQDRRRAALEVKVPEKGTVPLNWSQEASIAFVAGLLDSDGSWVFSDKSHQSYGYQISSVNRDFLVQVLYLLRQLGVPAHLGLMKDAERKAMPGGEYDCAPCWRVHIASKNAVRLLDLGLAKYAKRVYVGTNRPDRDATRFPQVTAVVPCGVADKVYCFTDPKRHRGVFNGILTGNCGEVPLRDYDACTLGSINLNRFYVEKDNQGTIDFERLRTTIFHAVHFLDNVLEVNTYALPEIADVTSKCRKVGLGVMGWADLLVRLGIPYASNQALSLAGQVAAFVNESAVLASEELAVKRGPFYYWDHSSWAKKGDKPRRNATVTVIAPTGSISIIAGCNFGIEPLFALSMMRNQAGMQQHDFYGEFTAVAKREGWHSDAIMAEVAKTGSCQGVPGVPARVQEVFKISADIECAWHVKMQAAFQTHVEDAVSKTINLPKSATVADVKEAYLTAWNLGCKGITVYRDGSRSKQVLSAGTGGTAGVSAPTIRRNLKSIPKVNGVQMRPGYTMTVGTPYGAVHVTINEHPTDGEAFECFVSLGKSGTETKALTEGLGRMMSAHLSTPSADSPREILKMLAEQNTGIGGGGQFGQGPDKVVSAPDGVAKTILHYLHLKETATSKRWMETRPGVFVLDAPAPDTHGSGIARLDICPKCQQATLTKGVGCDLCQACGFSSC